MLERIRIKNLALVRDAELEFSDKLNVLSGETGAGKSIIVDALMLLMGGKYDRTMLSYGADGGYVEGVFVFSSPEKTAFLEDYGFDADSVIAQIYRRRQERRAHKRAQCDGKNAPLRNESFCGYMRSERISGAGRQKRALLDTRLIYRRTRACAP